MKQLKIWMIPLICIILLGCSGQPKYTVTKVLDFGDKACIVFVLNQNTGDYTFVRLTDFGKTIDNVGFGKVR